MGTLNAEHSTPNIERIRCDAFPKAATPVLAAGVRGHDRANRRRPSLATGLPPPAIRRRGSRTGSRRAIRWRDWRRGNRFGISGLSRMRECPIQLQHLESWKLWKAMSVRGYARHGFFREEAFFYVSSACSAGGAGLKRMSSFRLPESINPSIRLLAGHQSLQHTPSSVRVASSKRPSCR